MARLLGLHIDPAGSTPIYLQIFDQIATRIRDGIYPPGHKLPPTRQLATELNTHRNTVVRAFDELQSAGFVQAVVGRGTFVTPSLGPVATAETLSRNEGLPWSRLFSAAVKAEPLERLNRWSQHRAAGDHINLTRLQPPHELLPSEELRVCLDYTLRTQGPRSLGYAPSQGLRRLRDVLAGELVRSGVPAQADDILVTSGSQQALDLIARTLVDPGDTVLVEGATYSGALEALAASRARVVDVPGDADGPIPAALDELARERCIKALYLMPNCRNPTGSLMSGPRRDELVGWSRRHGVPLIEDDYGSDLNLDGIATPPALRALDADVLHVGTLSKKLIPALRLGFFLAPPGLLRRFAMLKHATDLGTSSLLQHAVAEFIERGYLQAHLTRSLPIYRARRDALVLALQRYMPAEVHWDVPAHGVILWLRLPPQLEPEAVFEEARRQGVLVTPSSLYGVAGRESAGGLRLTFCAEPPERLAEGARRLGKALNVMMVRARWNEPSIGVI